MGMYNKCSNCKYYHKLKHSFKQGMGFTETACCIVLTRCDEDVDEFDSFVVEVEPDDMCEMFTEREELHYD